MVKLRPRGEGALLAATLAVSTGGRRYQLSDAAAEAIRSLAVVGLGQDEPDLTSLGAGSPWEPLSAACPDTEAATRITEILAVMALVDGVIDQARVDQVLEFAEHCGIAEHWLEDLSRSTEADLSPVIADMSERNLRSITLDRVHLDENRDLNAWLLPYEGDRADHALASRYQALATLAPGSLGYEFYAFYDHHRFRFAGQAGAANEMFTTPHDVTHLLSGYDTTPQGELLVSTFTARMHPVFPMEGHILPVIYSWHLGIEFNQLAGSYRGALDPAKFWVAWERGARTHLDTFSQSFDFWALTETPLVDLRETFGVPPLDPVHAAYSEAVPGVDYNPVA